MITARPIRVDGNVLAAKVRQCFSLGLLDFAGPTLVMLSEAKHLPKFIDQGTLAGMCKKILRYAQNDSTWTNGG